MTHTEKVALAMAWYDSGHEDRAAFQTLMESILAQPEQVPVAHVYFLDEPSGMPRVAWDNANGIKIGTKLYTTPPQRKPLTENELADLWYKQSTDWLEFARAIEAAHGITGEKNG